MCGANSKTITSHLRDLEKYHLIHRVVYPEVPPRVEYSLTEHGKAFLPVLAVIREWGATLPPPREK
jgi:DNA-binding HxlR family transcriptional regulator